MTGARCVILIAEATTFLRMMRLIGEACVGEVEDILVDAIVASLADSPGRNKSDDNEAEERCRGDNTDGKCLVRQEACRLGVRGGCGGGGSR